MGDTGDKFFIFTKKESNMTNLVSIESNMTNLVSIDSKWSKESIAIKIIKIGQV
jgi:hypothetical protein